MTIRRSARSVVGSNCVCICDNSSVRFILRDFFLNYLMLMRERLKQKCFRFDACDTHCLFAGG